MSDVSDLHGVYATPVRWNAETGALGYAVFDEATGEREIVEIELGSSSARFVMDLATRERGYGLIRSGVYDMRLSAVGAAPPEWPSDEGYKPAIGCWFWNPPLGELRLESNQSTLFKTVVDLWDRARTFTESSQGLQPVVHFIDRRERVYRQIGKTFWAPVIDIVGWLQRSQIPTFAAREPTVKAPLALDSQVRFALLGPPERNNEARDHPKQSRGKSRGPAKRGSLNEVIDDEIPEDL